MYSIIVGLIIFVSVLLILVVLVQNSKGGGLSSQFGGNSSNQFISSPENNNIEGLSPNIDRANEQNIIQNRPTPEDIGEVPNDLDSLI